MKKIILFFFILTAFIKAQTLYLEENFDYTAGTNLTNNGWTAHSKGGTNPITVNNGGLTFSGYVSSGIGNAALLNHDGEDVNKSLSSTVSSGTIYYSFLVNVSAVADGYFIHLNKNTTTFAARVFIKAATDGFNFGLSNSKTGAFGSTVYSTGTTYLCIVKYDVSTTGACSLWVKTESQGVPQTESEAGTPEVTSSGTGQTGITAIALRQYSPSQNIIVDGIRVSDSWSQAPLPIELTSFTIFARKNSVELNWQTATEVNNYGFEIERKYSGPADISNNSWEKIGFVQGNGNSNSPKYYSFIDKNLLSGYYSYRLKQIDYDGSYTYSDVLKVKVDYKPQILDVKNYPNPFNPITKIYYEIPEDGFVTLKIYNALGKEIKTLINENKIAGSYEIEFDASGLPTGIYFNVLQVDDKRVVRKMQLIK